VTPGRPPAELSLVVCTRDRAERLERLLASISGQRDAPPFELVVVDNGSRDRTGTVLANFAAAAPFPVMVVSEPVPGLGRARNRGAAVARGELVVFTDDDCRLPAGHLAGVAAAFADLDVDWLGGRILPGDGHQARVALLEDPTFRYFPPGGVVWVGAVQGANLAVRRAALEAVGGFDERLGAGTEFRCEDVDLCARLAAAGRRGARCPDLVVWHGHGRDPSTAGALEAANDVARGAFVAGRVAAGGPDARGYVRTWAASATRRWGWRPRNASRALAATWRELRGAQRWASARARSDGPRPGVVQGADGGLGG
jgi:GT2 family glycosyltransferase